MRAGDPSQVADFIRVPDVDQEDGVVLQTLLDILEVHLAVAVVGLAEERSGDEPAQLVQHRNFD